MAQLQKTSATLRISGDDLDPDYVSQLLKAVPTSSQRKGDRIRTSKGLPDRIAKLGMWTLTANDREPADLDGQIREIFDQLATDATVWQTITTSYKTELFCGLFMRYFNEGLSVSASSLHLLGSRGISIDLDMYRGYGENPPSN